MVQEISNFSLEKLFTTQRKDSLWSSVMYVLESGDDPPLPTLPVPLFQFSLINGVLCRKHLNSNENVTQFFIPTSFINTVFLLIYNTPQPDHPRSDNFLAIARRQYYWPTMRVDIIKRVSQYIFCAQTKGTNQTDPYS